MNSEINKVKISSVDRHRDSLLMFEKLNWKVDPEIPNFMCPMSTSQNYYFMGLNSFAPCGRPQHVIVLQECHKFLICFAHY